MGARYRLFSWYVRWAERHAGMILLGLLAIGALAFSFAIRLELHTDMAELLPPEHPAVLALRRISGRQKSSSNLVMLIHSPSAEANRQFVETLKPKLDTLVPDIATEVQIHPDTEVADYAARWKWLYADLLDLESAESLVERLIAKHSSPLWIDLEGDPDEELKKLRERLHKQLPKRNPAHYFESTDAEAHETYIGVRLWRKRDGVATVGEREMLATVKRMTDEVGPLRFHAAMKIDFTGPIAQMLDEQDAIREDLTVATAICTTLVLLAIFLYFRRISMIFVIGAPAVLGVLLSLMFARLTILYLNMNTAFLISIILGNGINAPIIVLSRYGEERRHGSGVTEALSVALSATLLGTFSAMAAASVAYGSLIITSFRGFNQFGLIGGCGMIAVWLLTFFMVPPLVLWGERHWPGRLTPGENVWRKPFAWIGSLTERSAGWVSAGAVALILAAMPFMWKFAKDPLEWNFNRLRSDETPSQKLWPRMEQMGMGDVSAGYIGNNGVLLVDDPEQADAVAAAMRDKDAKRGIDHTIKTVRTLHSVLPDRQAEKIEILGRVRAKIDKYRHRVDEEAQREIDSWRPPESLRVLVPADLPRVLREAFTETDGQMGRLIGIDADSSHYSNWNGHDLLRMAEVMQVDALGRTWVAASVETVFAGIIETMVKDGPRVTLCALLGVLGLLLMAFGWRDAIPVVSAVLLGIFWLSAVMFLMGERINFMNFAALPITLGVGADYSANIWARLKQDRGPLGHIIADTGSAVALCSLTTIIGYSSLLLSRNRALRSFGLMADLGEFICLMAALIVLPAFRHLWARRSKPVIEDCPRIDRTMDEPGS